MALITLCAALTAVAAARGTELVPERYLRPRDFNHHPFTDVGDGSLAKQPTGLNDVHPYAILASKRPREGRQFPDQEHVLYPNPPAAVLPRARPALVHVQPSHYAADPYNVIPKNYAFSYSVKDKHSGDDFSHSQAHNGKATRGQYRVKLPDGRVQVVSYTADHKGYRADVQYEGAAAAHGPAHQPVTPVYEHTSPAPDAYAPQHYAHSYSPTPSTYYQRQPSYTPAPQYAQHQPTYTATPAPYQHQHAYSPTPAPYQYSPSPTPYEEYSATPAPYRQQQYSPTPAPYQQEHAYSPTPSPYQQEHAYSPTPAPYQQEHAYSPTPAPYQHEQSYSPTPATYSDYAQQSYAGPTADYRLVPYNSQYAASAPSQSYPPSGDSSQQVYPSPTTAHNYASPSPITFPAPAPTPQQEQYQPSPGLQAYASPSPAYEASQYAPSAVEYDHSYASPSPSPFAVQPHLRSTPAPFARQFVTSTESSRLGHIVVTPRTQRNSNSNGASRRVFGAREHIIYRFKSSS